MHQKFLFLVLTFFLIVTCSSKPAKDSGPSAQRRESKAVSMEGKELANKEESNLVTEITFKEGDAGISALAKSELKSLYQKAAKKGEIDDIKVITWGDQEYPSVHKKELSDGQKKLVENRNENIEKYLKSFDKKADVELFSMAERPSTIKKMFASDDVKIKRTLEMAGIPNTDTTVKIPGKASKSIVIFVMEE